MKILEFQLSVTPLGEDRYLIRTEKVEPGVPLAEEQVSWPVADWVAVTRQLMDDPIVQFLNPVESDSSATPRPDLLTLGQEFYRHLFQGSLYDSWIAARSIAYHQEAMLRFRLGLKGDRLPRLPWEVLHAPPTASGSDRFRPLATGTEVLFSRYHSGPLVDFKGSDPLTESEPVRVLMAIAQPSDQANLTLAQEVKHLKTELAHQHPTPIELTLLQQPGRETLTQTLEQGHYHVFHYSGHSGLGHSGGDVYLVNPMSGLAEQIDGDDLAGLLVNNGIQLAIFNSCRSGHTIFNSEQEQSLAEALIQQGVPAVLAMAERIPDEVALTLTRLLYRNLSLGYPLDLSLSRARQGLLSAYGSSQLYWALPVLYLNPSLQSRLTIPLAVPDDEDVLPDWLKTGAIAAEEHDDAELATLIKDIFPTLDEGDRPQEPDPTPPADPAPPPPPIAPQLQVRVTPPKSRPIWPYVVGGMGAIALALTGGWVAQQVGSPTPEAVEASPDLQNLEPVSSDRVTGLAIESFSQGNLEDGLQAVTALLDRNALSLAESALAAVAVERLDDPAVSFLRGRLAWQAIAQDNPTSTYAISDARRYWETAAKGAPNESRYHTALGFAYYSEGLIGRANQAWYDAIALIEAETNTPSAAQQTPYAGLALGLNALALEPDARNAEELQRQAIALQRQVLTAQPQAFQAQALSQDWLWTDAMITTWQTLAP
ncbi:CHAT domain-containing protein [Spirulina major CS-329]|uniref:CHAT domain-containing protein n=1 Tax=Spirulina TaxID=1154 RepID=UPI00232FA8D3|nr:MULTISPECIES: CHAT domain-containing protein [Spirulina]MDB9494522.1 CHAT domain-containing protein [Spirulina subsalsa CS-330]MDB9501862.1 CHAT domain-containing protein [Spirulina major CS-329]